MPVAVYPALVTGDVSGGYRAEFADFAGATVSEPNAGDLLRAARERLRRELAELERHGRDWPSATPVEALGERLQAARAALLLVDVQVEETPVRVNISIGDRLLRRLDEAAEAQNMTRSGYIAAAVRQRLGETGGRTEGGPTSQRLFDEMSEIGRRVNEALGPESTFGRTLADLDARALEGLRTLSDRLGAAAKRPARGPSGQEDA